MGRGWLLAWKKNYNHHFEKVITCMVLKLTVCVRNVIYFLTSFNSFTSCPFFCAHPIKMLRQNKPGSGLNGHGVKLPKPGEIQIFGTFMVKFSILASYVLLKIGYFEIRICLWRHFDVIRWIFVLISVCWKEETHTYTMLPIRRIWWFSLQVHRGW